MDHEAEANSADTRRQERARRHTQVVTDTQMRLRQLEAAQRAARATQAPPEPVPQHYYAELHSPTRAARTR